MRRIFTFLLGCVSMLVCITAKAQTVSTVTGSVKTATSKESIPAVSVTIKGTSIGTFTNDKGVFKFSTKQKLPFTLIFSSVGYASKEMSYTGEAVAVELQTAETMGQEIVVSATRTQERILESPVSIERMGTNAIRNAAAPDFYNALANYKGVDMTTSSLNFRTLSTRGFNGSGNLRFNQLVDGMDNQAPGLNFSVGSIVSPTQLDVENVELLQGASSALYGSGGMTGTLLMTSKNPFKYQGLSFQIKGGVNHVDDKQRTHAPFHNWDFRYAQKINDKLAFKIGGEFTTAQDWQASDMRNVDRRNILSKVTGGTRANNANYDGVNVYGDEASASMYSLAQAVRAQVADPNGPLGAGGAFALGQLDAAIAGGAPLPFIMGALGGFGITPGSQYYPVVPMLLATSGATNNPYKNMYLAGAGVDGGYVSRTGYDEKYLVNYNNINVKLNGALHYKINSNLEASISANYGTGNTVYTAADRYSIKNLRIGQYKFELKSKNWFLRAYTTQENSGDSYTATTAAVAINNAWKSNTDWFTQYTGAYGLVYLGLAGLPTGTSNNAIIAHNAARTQADAGRLLPGTAQFEQALATAISKPISNKGDGAKFNDKTSMYHYEGQYNFADKIKFAEVLVGASYRRYTLNSEGTLFADTTGTINVDDMGAYIQLQKKLMNDKLKLTLSGRYDKSTNFEGRFTPRFTATYKVAENNYVRASFQQAYRFPTMQDQWINLKTPAATLIGGLKNFETYYDFKNNPAYTAESVDAYRQTVVAGTPNPGLLVKANFAGLKAEVSNSIELGYRGMVKKDLLIDAYVYYSQFQNFIGRQAVARGHSANPSLAVQAQLLASPFTTDAYSFVNNSSATINAIGWGIGAEYNAGKNYMVTANISGDQLNNVAADFFTQYNSPKIRFNVGISNANVYKDWGFGAIYRWQDKVDWQGTFGAAQIPSYGTVDGFISKKFAPIKSLVKIGCTNLYNKYYISGFGNPQVGGLYYISLGYNIF